MICSDEWSFYKRQFADFMGTHPCVEIMCSYTNKQGNLKNVPLYYCTKNAFEEGQENTHYSGIMLSQKKRIRRVVLSVPRMKGAMHNECTYLESLAEKADRIGPKMLLLPNGQKITHFLSSGSLYRFMRYIFETRKFLEPRLYVRSALNKLLRLWKRGFVHRDIKVDNLLVNPEKKELLLIDFGMSCRYIQRKYWTKKQNLNIFSAPFCVDREAEMFEVDDRAADSKGMGLSLLHMYKDILVIYGNVLSQSGLRGEQIGELTSLFQQALLEKKEELLNSVWDVKVKDLLDQMIYRPEETTIESLEEAIKLLS